MPSEGEVNYYIVDKRKLAIKIERKEYELEELKKEYYDKYGLTEQQKKNRYSSLVVLISGFCVLVWGLYSLLKRSGSVD